MCELVLVSSACVIHKIYVLQEVLSLERHFGTTRVIAFEHLPWQSI
jgi:hypothetical protein